MLIVLNDIAVIIRGPKTRQLERERERESSSIASRVCEEEREREWSCEGASERTSAAHYDLMVGSNPFRPRAMSTLFAAQWQLIALWAGLGIGLRIGDRGCEGCGADRQQVLCVWLRFWAVGSQVLCTPAPLIGIWMMCTRSSLAPPSSR